MRQVKAQRRMGQVIVATVVQCGPRAHPGRPSVTGCVGREGWRSRVGQQAVPLPVLKNDQREGGAEFMMAAQWPVEHWRTQQHRDAKGQEQEEQCATGHRHEHTPPDTPSFGRLR